MLRSEKQLEEFAIGATDGPIGRVKDFYFDDEAWVIRYLVVDTSKWLGGREVLISPYSLGSPDWAGATLPVNVTKEQVRNSPGVEQIKNTPPYDSGRPFNRESEGALYGHYSRSGYWRDPRARLVA